MSIRMAGDTNTFEDASGDDAGCPIGARPHLAAEPRSVGHARTIVLDYDVSRTRQPCENRLAFCRFETGNQASLDAVTVRL